MSPRFLLALTLLLSACQGLPAEPPPVTVVRSQTYAGDPACVTCHESESEGYQSHAMATSFYPMTPDRVIEEFEMTPIRHEASDFSYRVYQDGERFYQSEFREDPEGSRSHQLVREITHVVGSANAARTYISEENGRYYELPLTWYAQANKWDFSPGYENNNQRFDRKLGSRCMACHTDAPDVIQGTSDAFVREPLAISCERCHGPGRAHVEARRAVPEPEAEVDPTITNPAHLDMDRRLDVCQQCHLNGAVVMYPDGTDPYSFRPGDALSDHQTMYASAHETGMKVISQADGMKQSACFLETIDSGRPLECTTCHDPHQGFRDQGPDYFNATCQSCHASIATEVPEAMRAQHSSTANCVDCHMPKRGAEDAPHTSFTDHFIRTVPESVPDEDSDVPDVVLEALYGEESKDELAMAYMTYGFSMGDTRALNRGITLARETRESFLDPAESNAAALFGKALLRAGAPSEAVEPLRAAVAGDTTEVDRLVNIARALDESGASEEAGRFYKKAVELGPHNVDALSEYANHLLRMGELDESLRLYELALAEEPSNARIHNGIAAALTSGGRFAEAIVFAEKAVDLDPDYVDALTNFGTLHARLGSLDESLEILRRAAILGREVGNPTPILNLGLIAAEMGLWDESINALGFLVINNPDSPDLRLLLARTFVGQGERVSAIAQLNAGLKAEPGNQALLELLRQLESQDANN